MIHAPVELAASFEQEGTNARRAGKVHRIHSLGTHYIVLCRGFVPMANKRLNFTDSKPDCKACLKIKNR